MASRTSSQAGNTNSSPFAFGTAVAAGDSLTINHAVAVDASVSVVGLAINAALTVNAGVTLTLAGNATQGNTPFTLSAGSALVFDCTAADRRWLMGDAANFTNYSSCVFKSTGSSGSHATVSKTGSNHCWIDDFSEASGAGSDKTNYDLLYCDFSGIGKADGSFSLAMNSFGSSYCRLDRCTFDSCGTALKNRPYTWGGSANQDYYVRDCKFTNSTGSYAASFKADGSSGSGAHDITRNSFDVSVELNSRVDLVDNYFARGTTLLGGPLLTDLGNLYRVGSGDSDQGINAPTVSSCYWLGNLNHPGNPHCFGGPPDGSTISGCVFEFPAASAIDSGECVYVNVAGINLTVTGNLAVPSDTDGYALGNMAHHARPSGTAKWSVTKNTVVGLNNAFVAYTEAASNVGTLYSALKSNLVVDPSGSSAALLQDVTVSVTDAVLAANATNNGKFGPLSYADATSGATLSGYRSHFTTAPGSGDVTGSPNFLDTTLRTFGKWAVHKGAATSGDTLATKHAAGLALVAATPSLIRSDLIPWVKAGYSPTNPAFATAGHDAGVIGAVAYTAAASFLPAFLSRPPVLGSGVY